MQHEEKSWLCFALCVLFVFVQRINSQQHDDGTGPYTNDVLETSVDYAFPRSAILQDYEYATITRILVRESRGNSLLVGWDGSIVRVTRDGSVSRGKIPVHDFNRLSRFIALMGTLKKDYRGMDRSIDCSKYWVLIYADKANWTFCFDAHRLPEDVWAIVLIIRQLSEDVDWKPATLTDEEASIVALDDFVDVESRDMTKEIECTLEEVTNECNCAGESSNEK